MSLKPRVRVPDSASAGEIITLKVVVAHRMESGLRRDDEGEPIPRHILKRFTCTFNGLTVFACDMQPGISANPFFEFTMRVEQAGTFMFTWVDDEDEITVLQREITLV